MKLYAGPGAIQKLLLTFMITAQKFSNILEKSTS